MTYLCVDLANELIYEGANSGIGRGIWPTPVVTQAALNSEGKNPLDEIKNSFHSFSYRTVFREDFYDPISGIRRGRLYDIESERALWQVTRHPADATEGAGLSVLKKELRVFKSHHISIDQLREPRRISIVLGTEELPSLWHLFHLERLYSGDQQIYIRPVAGPSFLEPLDIEKVPTELRQRFLAEYRALSEDYYKANPESVIDHCRDLAVVILQTKFSLLGKSSNEDDLAKLIAGLKTLDEVGNRLFRSAAFLVNGLHVRRKPNEAIRYNFRAVTIGDAELAVACVNFLIREVF